MRNLNESNLTDVVVAQLQNAGDARFRAIMESLIRHLHAFARETELTEAEWFAGIQFLTATGHTCDAKRQEFILLSDAVNHRKPSGASETTVLGPFYVPGSKSMSAWANIAEGIAGVPAYIDG